MISKLILKEVGHRKINFLLSTIAATFAVALIVAFYTSSMNSKNETRVLTRDLGFNLRIIPAETNMDLFWVNGFSNETMPESNILEFGKAKNFSFAHLTATLQKQITWNDQQVILTGLSPKEIEPSGRKKSKMIFAIPAGKAYLGYEIARIQNLHQGDTIQIMGESFEVNKTLSETGTLDDACLYIHLNDAQKLLTLEGQINEIKAINCMCMLKVDGVDPLTSIRKELSKVLPDTRAVRNQSIAITRERQRLMVEKYFGFILPLVIIVFGLIIGVLSYLNVKDRQSEIGILRATGYHTRQIAWLFMGKSLFIGIIGALMGFGLGTFISMTFGPEIFKITAASIKPFWSLLYWALLAAPFFAMISSFIPTVLAITEDPAVILSGE